MQKLTRLFLIIIFVCHTTNNITILTFNFTIMGSAHSQGSKDIDDNASEADSVNVEARRSSFDLEGFWVADDMFDVNAVHDNPALNNAIHCHYEESLSCPIHVYVGNSSYYLEGLDSRGVIKAVRENFVVIGAQEYMPKREYDIIESVIKKVEKRKASHAFRKQRTTTNDSTCVSETGFIEQDPLMSFGVLHECIEDARAQKVAKKSFLSRLSHLV